MTTTADIGQSVPMKTPSSRGTHLVAALLLAACSDAFDVETDARPGAGTADLGRGGAGPPGDAMPGLTQDAAGGRSDASSPAADAAVLAVDAFHAIDPDTGIHSTDGGASLLDAAPVFVDGGVPCPDGNPQRRYFPDADGDGYGDVVDLSGRNPVGCEAPAGYVGNDQDCDDARPETNPSASERCNGFDDDCNGAVDDDAAGESPFYRDVDSDGFGDFYGDVVFACAAPAGYADNFDDCNDSSPDITRCAAGEVCSVAQLCLSEGECRSSLDCGPGLICADAGLCEPGGPCGGESYSAARVLPNLLIVLDRSCSMRARVGGVRKWQAAVDAITALTRQYEGQIRFGLSLFPDLQNPSCGQGDVIVPVADGAEGPIRDLLAAALDSDDRHWPDGPCVTNIDTAMEQAAAEPRLNAAGERGFAMLVTDGQQAGCSSAGGDAGTTRIITEMNARGVSTFVVGFGGEVDARQLGVFAEAGGVPRPMAPTYYQADDAPALVAALQDIGQQLVTCEFALEQAPPNIFNVHVFFDRQEEVPRDVDHLDGWDYDAATQTVTFYGASCDRLTSREVTDVDVVFGCPSGEAGGDESP